MEILLKFWPIAAALGWLLLIWMAQILTPDTSQVKGNSWSGKVPLTGDQLEELYQIGRTGALNFSFEDHSLEDHLV